MNDSATPTVLETQTALSAAAASSADVAKSTPVPQTASADVGVPIAKASDPMIAFAYACLRREFESLLANRPNRDEPPPPEAVHQMRIATRRLRIALRMFRRMLPAEEGERFRKNFRWFARALGEVRDLDVYAENFRAYLAEIPQDQLQDLGGYELHLRRTRAEARSDLCSLFSDERYASLITLFGAFLDGAPTAAALRRWKSFRVSDGFKKYLHRSAKRVQKLGRKIGHDARAKKLHRLRIRAKRLRYELEFFAHVLPSLDKVAKATKALQDMLGTHQDACTASARLEDYANTLRARASVPGALQTLLENQQRKAEEARNAFPAEWRRFEKTIARTKLKLAA